MQRLVAVSIFLFAILFLCLPSGYSLPSAQGAIASPDHSLDSSLKEDKPKEEKSSETDDDSESDSDEKESSVDDSESDDDKSDAKSDDKASDDDEAEKKSKEKTDSKSDDDKKSAAKSEKKEKKKAEKKKAKPHKVKRDALKIEVELDGIFVADEMEEVALRPEAWSSFKVLEAVEHGSTVKKGDVLVRFDDEKLEDSLAQEALEQRLGELSLMQDEEEFPRLKRLLELSYESAERRNERTKADYKYYQATDRPFSVEIAHYRYKQAVEQLASAQEELDQLQKMYEADDLTEATEEIVLRRQSFAVETAKLVLKLNKESRDYTLNVSLPRSDEYYETELEESKLAYQQAKTALDIGMTRKSFDMEKKRNARAKSVERHGKLLSDKGLMVLRAPCDGVVYYGKCSRGKWSQITSMKGKLKPFGSASANSVLMTIVKPGSLHLESTVGEKNLPDVTSGLKATVIPTADKEQELTGAVTSIGMIPGASNKHDVELSVDLIDGPKWLVAGMTCKAKVVAYENKEALVIPQDLVQTDEDNKKVKYVMLLESPEDETEEAKPVRRNVKLGRKKGKIVEVLKGLEEDDEIVKEEKDKKKDDE